MNIANGVTGLSVSDSAVKTMMQAWRQLDCAWSPVVQWPDDSLAASGRLEVGVLITLTSGNVDAIVLLRQYNQLGTAQPNH